MVIDRLSRCLRLCFTLAGLGLLACGHQGGRRPLTIASTTSTENSGLYDVLLPQFTKATGIAVRVIAVGTGQALELGRRGDADVVIVHHPPSEETFVRDGHGVARVPFMRNSFVLVGPGSDPNGLRQASDVLDALRRWRAGHGAFLSRGDESGTHRREQELWAQAGVKVGDLPAERYRASGQGMGATLNMAIGLDATTLTDLGTWLAFENRGAHEVLVRDDPPLFNPYAAIAVNAKRHAHVRADAAQALIRWLTSSEGQAAIGAYRLGGVALFVPTAVPGGNVPNDAVPNDSVHRGSATR